MHSVTIVTHLPEFIFWLSQIVPVTAELSGINKICLGEASVRLAGDLITDTSSSSRLWGWLVIPRADFSR
jgi:hypothetical protein